MLAAGHFISSRFSRALSIVRAAGRSLDDMTIKPPNERPPVDAGTAHRFAIESHLPGTTEAECSMQSVLPIIACVMLLGCGPPPPVPKETHIKQVQLAIVKAGGETNILTESRTLFMRLASFTNNSPFDMAGDRRFEGLSGIRSLGDAFQYEPSEPNRVSIRVHNSHFDGYFIVLVNPDLPQPPSFERIAGNVGFIEPGGAANRSQSGPTTEPFAKTIQR